MSTIMENLINNKFYVDKGEIVKKLSVFNAYKVITDAEYAKLMDLTTQKYPEVTAS